MQPASLKVGRHVASSLVICLMQLRNLPHVAVQAPLISIMVAGTSCGSQGSSDSWQASGIGFVLNGVQHTCQCQGLGALHLTLRIDKFAEACRCRF